MRRFFSFLILFLLALTNANSLLAADCAYEELWFKEFKAEGRGSDKETAFNECSAELSLVVTKLLEVCGTAGGHNEFDIDPICSRSNCYYYGPPVRSYYCFHKNVTKCCSKQ
jgi:hypothetical protein